MVDASEVTNTEARRSVKRGEPVSRPQSPVAGIPEESRMQTDNYVRDISTLRIEDSKEAGGKGANLGELVVAELPVPPGWQAVRDAGAPLVVAAPREAGQPQRFRPNAVVTVERPPPAAAAGRDRPPR